MLDVGVQKRPIFALQLQNGHYPEVAAKQAGQRPKERACVDVPHVPMLAESDRFQNIEERNA